MLTEQERKDLISRLNISFCTPALWKDRESFLNLTDEQYKDSLYDLSAAILLRILKGDIASIQHLMNLLPDVGFEDFIKPVIPTISNRDFFHSLSRLSYLDVSLEPYYSTACGRPSILNGLRDFSYYGDFVLKHKDKSLQLLKALYGNDYKQVYDIVSAEIYYQRNDNFDAMVRITSAIPILEQNKSYIFLVVALYQQIFILTMNGEVKSASVIMQHLRERVQDIKGSSFEYNIDAMSVRLALYDGNLEFVNAWLEKQAPDENKELNLMEVYSYFVKLRCYLLYDKHLALLSLAEQLRFYFEISRRHMDVIFITCMEALSWYKTGKKEKAFELMDKALELAEKYHIYRTIADEGVLMFKLLQEYQKSRGSSSFLSKVMSIARHVSILYPHYLNISQDINTNFTEMEKDILRLLEQGKTYDEIAEIFFISVNTVRYHIKKIYPKLDVSSSSQAIFKAKKIGLI